MERKNHKNQDIRNILTVLGTAILSAAIFAFLFLHYYNPSGLYIAGNTLLDPAVIQEIDQMNRSSKEGKKKFFVFDHMELTYLNSQNKIQKQTISLDNYKKFYSMIASERSLNEVNKGIEDLFLSGHPTVLSITLHKVENSYRAPSEIHQKAQFVSEDYFRVQLFEKQGEWAYFYQPHIYKNVMDLFVPL